jgi:hypothetical protein
MIDPILISTILVGLVKGIIQLAQLSGMTEEEVNEMFNKEWEELKQNTPDKLPDA